MSKYEIPFASTLFITELTVDGYRIDPSGAVLNQVLKYNGTSFVPGASGGAADLGNWTFTGDTASDTGAMIIDSGSPLTLKIAGTSRAQLYATGFFTNTVNSLSGVTLNLGTGDTNVAIGSNSGSGTITLSPGSGGVVISAIRTAGSDFVVKRTDGTTIFTINQSDGTASLANNLTLSGGGTLNAGSAVFGSDVRIYHSAAKTIFIDDDAGGAANLKILGYFGVTDPSFPGDGIHGSFIAIDSSRRSTLNVDNILAAHNSSVSFAGSSDVVSIAGYLSLSNGSAATPALAFTSDTDTGFYHIAANRLGIAVGGAFAAEVAASIIYLNGGIDANVPQDLPIGGLATSITIKAQQRNTDGTNAAPSYSFTNDTDTGFYRDTANQIGMAVNGVRTLQVRVGGIIYGTVDTSFVQLNGTSCAFSYSGVDLALNASSLTTGATFLPASNDTYNIGSSSQKFRDGYFSGTLTTNKEIVRTGGTGVAITNDSTARLQLDDLVGGNSASIRCNVGYFDGGVEVSYVENPGGGNINFYTTGIVPGTDNATKLGDATHRFTDGYFAGIVTTVGGYVGPSIGTSTSALHPFPTGTGELLCTGLVTDITGASGVDITLANDGYLTAGAVITSLIGNSLGTLHGLPSGVDDIVSTDATQTLINKTIDAASNTIINLGVALFSFVDFANNHTGATLNTGNFSMGAIFYLVTPGSCTGGRFYWAGGAGALTVKVSLWDSSNTRVKNASVAVNAAGIYSVTFSSPQVINDIYQVYTIAMWETTGAKFTTFDTPANDIRLLPNNNRTSVVTTPTAGGSGYANGKTIVAESDIFVGGDAMPDPASILTFPNKSPIEAIII